MLKKNQLALILLTLVLMLSIYYIKSPFKSDGGNEIPADNLPDTPTSGRLEELTALRLSLREERDLRILALDEIIASDEASVAEKNIALNEKNYVNSLTEKELLLEQEIISRGYQDAFVHASSYGVDITIVSEENSVVIAAQIIKDAKEEFHDIEAVMVQFKTAAEVSGNASAS